jgi:hypothetical protein
MPSAPEPLHLLIANAVPLWATGQALSAPPALDALLARMRPAGFIEADDACPATPFEIALARAHGLPGEPGRVPWAAFESGAAGTPCAWLAPCHWQLGMDQARLLDPAELALAEGESRALLAAVQPLLAEDGVTLTCARPDAWLAQGELLRGLRTWSMQRALHRRLTREMLALAPAPAQDVRLRRLQAEVQMLLHGHPVNEARERQGRWPVNALWIAGAGALDAPCPPNPGVRVAQFDDAAGIETLRRAIDGGGDARLTLCGPRHALTFAPARGWRDRITNFFSPPRLQDLQRAIASECALAPSPAGAWGGVFGSFPLWGKGGMGASGASGGDAAGPLLQSAAQPEAAPVRAVQRRAGAFGAAALSPSPPPLRAGGSKTGQANAERSTALSGSFPCEAGEGATAAAFCNSLAGGSKSPPPKLP